MVHVASVCPGVHAGAAEATSVSWPTFPVSIEVLMNRWPVVFAYVPAGAVTFRVIVQTPFGANVPLANATDVAPVTGTGEKAPEPQPLYAMPGVPATVKPAGNVSVKFTPVKESVVGFDSVNVSVDVPPGEIALGLKAFAMVTDAGATMFAVRKPTPKSAL
jgi:hypothetical protein